MIQSGSIEYNRVTRLTKDVKGFNDAPTFYIADLSTTTLELTLQDKTSKEPIEGFSPFLLSPTLISSPTGSNSPLNSNENNVTIEFTFNKPTGSIPDNSNYFVEWSDELGELDWFELNISDKTGDETLLVDIPY